MPRGIVADWELLKETLCNTRRLGDAGECHGLPQGGPGATVMRC